MTGASNNLPGFILLAAIAVQTLSQGCVEAGELDSGVNSIVQSHCLACHSADEASGGIDLETLAGDFDAETDLDLWVRVEAAIANNRMPPPSEAALTSEQRQSFASWFEQQFVMPGGVQHAGRNYPRRLTREELQNTLEDILHVDIRETVTNSRLHVIPDTIIEKFFAAGVRGASGFSNDAATLSEESVDIETMARCFSLVLSLVDSNEQARTRLFGAAQIPQEMSADEVREFTRRFGGSAFRRPLTASEVDAFVAVFHRMVRRKSAYQAMKSAFLAILLSPSFLYRFEESVDGQTLIVGDELATRLSYFLWSAPPDQTLRDLAARGELQKPDVLKSQVQRMLTDPKRIALAENLGGEWFDYKQLRQQSAVNQRSDRMAGFYRTQWEEALLFFDSLIRYDQPLWGIVNADWAFTNAHQSGIYRLQTGQKEFDSESALPPVNIHYRSSSRQIEQGNYEYKHAPLAVVKLTDPDRGGFLTIGPTLSVTSTPNRTSPIRRGVWILERILGTHFEVPKDVPDLEATQKKAQSQQLNLSHAEILKLHSSQDGCAACHKFIDPIGFGLEVFDQWGIERTDGTAGPAGEKMKWTPKETPGVYADQSWPLSNPLVPGAETRVFFHYTRGGQRLNIRNVRLTSGDIQLVDPHFGFAGAAHQENVWSFAVPADAPATGWILTAEVQGDGGTDSNGVITVSGPSDKGPGYRLPNGRSFSSPSELKQTLLADYRDQIVDNAIRRVLSYALGRKIKPIDRPAVAEIKGRLETADFRMNTLIEAVVLSYPFRHKEN